MIGKSYVQSVVFWSFMLMTLRASKSPLLNHEKDYKAEMRRTETEPLGNCR